MRALIGFSARLPHAFTHTCDRMSVSTRDVNPAALNACAMAMTRSDRAPSSSPTGKRSPSTRRMTPGWSRSAAG